MKKLKTSTLRALAAGAVLGLVCLGLVLNTGLGTLSSFGYNEIAAICPLGALESIFGSWMLVPRVIIALVGIIVLIVVFGKAFCAWLCPVPHLQRIFRTKKQKNNETQKRQEAADYALENWRNKTPLNQPKALLDTRHVVLGGTLLSTAVFGFPVFCLVCPVGLSFAVVISLWRFIQFNEPSWGLLIFPLILIIEVIALRKWCTKICPMGALFSLFASFNKMFRPTIDTKTCLRDDKGIACQACDSACPEFIDPHSDKGKRPLTECIKCKSCSDACPANCISFPFLPPSANKRSKKETPSVNKQ